MEKKKAQKLTPREFLEKSIASSPRAMATLGHPPSIKA